MIALRLALRQFAKLPGFSATVVLTLALGIGSSTTMFSLLYQIVLKPLPYEESGQLVQLWEDSRGSGVSRNTVAGGVAHGWREQATVFEGIVATTGLNANLTGVEHPSRLAGMRVSSNYLGLFRIRPRLGRDFGPDEGAAGKRFVTILSHKAWQAYFAGDPNIVGTAVQLGQDSVTVVGVLPKEARLTTDVDFIVPFAHGTPGWSPAFAGHNLFAYARLKPGVTLDQARAEMTVITERMHSQYPRFKKDWGALVLPLHDEILGPLGSQLALLFGATFCVLLIACSNVAGLLLARAVSRRNEAAVRLALGASRKSIVAQFLVENVFVSLVGGLLGVLLSYWGVAFFEALRPAEFAQGLPVHVDVFTLGFALLVSILTGILSGLIPAWRLSQTDAGALKNGGRGTIGGAQARLRGFLVVAQVSISLVLLTGACLLLRSLERIQSKPLGFEPSGVLLADLSLSPDMATDAAARVRYLDAIAAKVGAVPGVQTVGILPFLPMNNGYTETAKPGDGSGEGSLCFVNFGSGDFLRALGLRLREGRTFSEADNRPQAPLSVLINRSLAESFFPGKSAVGQKILLLGKFYEVVGVTDDVLFLGAERGMKNMLVIPEVFSTTLNDTLVVRTSLPPLSLSKSVRDAVLAVSSQQPLAGFRTYDQVVARRSFNRSLMLTLLGAFSGIALLLSAVGLYGILAFSVEKRTQELGIRSALGASQGSLFMLVVGGGLKLAVAGVALGILGAFCLRHLISGYLYEVSADDPLTFALAAAALLAIALAASFLPARRAADINPVEALRKE